MTGGRGDLSVNARVDGEWGTPGAAWVTEGVYSAMLCAGTTWLPLVGSVRMLQVGVDTCSPPPGFPSMMGRRNTVLRLVCRERATSRSEATLLKREAGLVRSLIDPCAVIVGRLHAARSVHLLGQRVSGHVPRQVIAPGRASHRQMV